MYKINNLISKQLDGWNGIVLNIHTLISLQQLRLLFCKILRCLYNIRAEFGTNNKYKGAQSVLLSAVTFKNIQDGGQLPH